MSASTEILNRLRSELVVKLQEAEARSMYSPVSERIKIYTTKFPELLKKYTGKERLTKEFGEELEKLSKDDARFEKEIAEGYDYCEESNKAIKEIVDIQMQIAEIDRQLYYARSRS